LKLLYNGVEVIHQVLKSRLKFAILHVTSNSWPKIPVFFSCHDVPKTSPLLYATDAILETDNLTQAPTKMAYLQSFLRALCSLLLFLTCSEALKFDIEAASRGDPKGTRCIRNFVAKDTLVVVTATVDGQKGDGMVVNMHVSLQSWSLAQRNVF
jgi:hypothetical protein